MSAIEMNNELFENKVLGGNEPVLVEFWAPWCVYCRRIAVPMERVAVQREETLDVFQVDIDQEPGLAEQERIEVVPTLVVYRGGEVIGSLVAPESKARIDDFLEEVLS